MRLVHLLLSAALVAAPAGASARNIVLSNDDGLSSNLIALYHALKAAEHDVVVSVPCTGQSGQGAALAIGQPLVPLTAPCINDAAQPGDPGAGPMTREDLPQGDFYYVNGTPIMALLQGIELVGMERWGAEPDLVLSGPNEGQNVGAIVLSSGTVSNVQYAALRGLPAIALSAGANTEGEDLANPLSVEVARLSLDLIAVLEKKAGAGPLLPRGVSLNVNFPDKLEGAQWRLSRIGTFNAYSVGFTGNMAESASPTIRAMAAARGMEIPQLPGINFDFNTGPPAAGQENDESILSRQHITVSPMQAGYDLHPAAADLIGWNLADLFLPAGE